MYITNIYQYHQSIIFVMFLCDKLDGKSRLSCNAGWDIMSQNMSDWYAFLFTAREERDRINAQCLALFHHLVFFIVNCMSRTAGPEQQDVVHSLFFSSIKNLYFMASSIDQQHWLNISWLNLETVCDLRFWVRFYNRL